jgi:hypothetical protein
MEIKIKDRQKFLMITAIVVMALLIGNSVVYEPLMNSWSARQDRIKDLKKNVKDDNDLISERARILAKWDRMKGNVLPMNSSLAGSKILQKKDAWVQQSSVSLDDFAPQLKQDNDQNDSTNVVTTWECRADASGYMRSILNLLWAVENDPMGVQLEDVEISAKDNNGQEMAMGLTLSMLVLDNGGGQSQ